MTDGFKPQAPQEGSQEFEDFENAQASQGQPKQQPRQPQPKPQETLNVKDEVGKAIETATQSIFGPTDPAQVQQQQLEQSKKKQDEQKKITNIKNFLSTTLIFVNME